MRIEFFKKNGEFDADAIKGGVYQVELLAQGRGSNVISLYIGESVWMASRCGRHLYALYENPEYFGLTPDDLKDDKLILRFRVLEVIKLPKAVLGTRVYKERELYWIEKNQPLTQSSKSDQQLKKDVRLKNVRNKMIELDFVQSE